MTEFHAAFLSASFSAANFRISIDQKDCHKTEVICGKETSWTAGLWAECLLIAFPIRSERIRVGLLPFWSIS